MLNPLMVALLSIFVLVFTACNSHKGEYSIRDFNPTLQPYLKKIVSKGIVGYDAASNYVEKHATDVELEKLSTCEHPVLRALAFREMLMRPSFDHFALVMKNLDDTAIVTVDYGEWGMKYLTVSDDILYNSMWKDEKSKKKVIEEILLHHTFLTQAYYKASELPAEEKYYQNIKQMAQYSGNDGTITIINFQEIEYALYALARYKRKEDIPMIKAILKGHSRRMSDVSFGLMAQYPDTAYLKIFEDYFRWHFYTKICDNWGHSVNTAISFISSIAVYKNERSAKILKTILDRKPFIPCSADTLSLKYAIAHAIKNNRCRAYWQLQKQVEAILRDEKRNTGTLTLPFTDDQLILPKDTSKETIRW